MLQARYKFFFAALPLIGLIAAALMLNRANRSDSQGGDSAFSPAKNPAAEAKTNWPVFGRNQVQSRTAEGSLPDFLSLLWKFQTAGAVKSSAVISSDVVYIGSSDANLYAIDLHEGSLVWSYRTGGGIEASPLVLDGTVFIGSTDCNLYAVDAGEGSLLWTFKTGGQITGSANWARRGEGEKLIIVGSYDNRLYALDARHGKVVWSYDTGNFINGTCAVDGGKAVFGGCDAQIHVVRTENGEGIRKINSGSYVAASPAVEEGRAYVGNYEGVFLCCEINTGRIIWQCPKKEAAFFSSPALGGQVVIVGCRDRNLYCLNRGTGVEIWSFRTLGEINSSPAICGDKVVFGSDDGRIYMAALADGRKLWSYQIGQAVASSPAVSGEIVVVGGGDGFVYAFGPKQ